MADPDPELPHIARDVSPPAQPDGTDAELDEARSILASQSDEPEKPPLNRRAWLFIGAAALLVCVLALSPFLLAPDDGDGDNRPDVPAEASDALELYAQYRLGDASLAAKADVVYDTSLVTETNGGIRLLRAGPDGSCWALPVVGGEPGRPAEVDTEECRR